MHAVITHANTCNGIKIPFFFFFFFEKVWGWCHTCPMPLEIFNFCIFWDFSTISKEAYLSQNPQPKYLSFENDLWNMTYYDIDNYIAYTVRYEQLHLYSRQTWFVHPNGFGQYNYNFEFMLLKFKSSFKDWTSVQYRKSDHSKLA